MMDIVTFNNAIDHRTSTHIPMIIIDIPMIIGNAGTIKAKKYKTVEK